MADIKNLFHINAPVKKVYNAIATINGLRNWWTAETTGNENIGGTLQFRFGNYGGPDMVVKELKPNKLVQWNCVDGMEDWKGTELSFILDSNEGKTRVRFAHANWKNDGDFFAACSFTWGQYMESLRQYCETGKGKPFGSKD
jgi:uncharacterized protein YndB with AHSA1/START domain